MLVHTALLIALFHRLQSDHDRTVVWTVLAAVFAVSPHVGRVVLAVQVLLTVIVQIPKTVGGWFPARTMPLRA